MTTIVEFRDTRTAVFKSSEHPVFEDADLSSTEAFIYGPSEEGYEWGYIERITVYSVVNDKLYPIALCHLTLENQEWISDDLQSLEAKLYEYMKDMGSFEPTPSEMRQRLLSISEEGMVAFWEAIARLYPECKSGDLGPTATRDFEQAVYKVVTTWRDNNGGGQNVN